MRNAMMDVSDGLLLDAQRLAEASGCAPTIDLDALPLSQAFIADRGERPATHACSRRPAATIMRLLAALPPEVDPLTTFFTFRDDDHPHRDSRRGSGIRSADQRRQAGRVAGETGL